MRRASLDYSSSGDESIPLPPPPPSLDVEFAVKKIINEYGSKACVIEEPCKTHALRHGPKFGQPDWTDILRFDTIIKTQIWWSNFYCFCLQHTHTAQQKSCYAVAICYLIDSMREKWNDKLFRTLLTAKNGSSACLSVMNYSFCNFYIISIVID